ncbi:MAG: nucleotide exchange factor GrpE [Candidatus Yanofskybacteria bacterium]|nr:nucleotide exchange factor GrpE [Candidatus Yanofskybacteria bacterium]
MEDQNQNLKTVETQKEVENENAELDICKKQAEEYLNNWKRERADFVNYKKDEGKRMEEFVKFANEGLILELLDTLDDLYLAAKQTKDSGLSQVIKKFEDLLKKYGVERIIIGEKFNPMYHEIIEGTEGEKIEEIRAGYTMHGRVIRPTRVKIIK